ncbi:extracellular catalytic domain type 1 short-chain-length polyhydroxyalkanoate depolymerase [Methylocapsa aurea]|uniref:extracellular catalytic domain type 1 short-chain-length polyhydroxyalkanoate depolymerase n=1 Tax=Methylocapsa aurea TaxID=663610 RepID=UPI000A031453|nr:PHB depolymerase family esterase [Methylocapsa aurea]
MRENLEFGSNPGNLGMHAFVPDDLAHSSALVVALHGGQQSADEYDQGAGWSALARQHGFAVLYPEQRGENNSQNCFNWFNEKDIQREEGEVASIRAMIKKMLLDHNLDPNRIFVTGLSAGGAMACALLAAYPSLFSGGAVIAGLPYRAALGTFDAFIAMSFAPGRSAKEWGDLVRQESPGQTIWPRISVWHGTRDDIVSPANGSALVRQWIDLHQVDEAGAVEDEIDGQTRLSWRNAAGTVVVEHYVIDGMAHGVPVKEAAGFARAPSPFVLEAGISSTFHIAKSWGLLRQEPVMTAGPGKRRGALRAGPAATL